MKTILSLAQIILSVLLVAAILLQSQGSGLGSSWGGGGETYHTKRGLEKVIFYFTIVGTILFALLSVANLMV